MLRDSRIISLKSSFTELVQGPGRLEAPHVSLEESPLLQQEGGNIHDPVRISSADCAGGMVLENG